ncbi:MAG: transcription termination factor NusA [Patescibacteria group bacterium]|nr:transcription termination factor NusA [Patescibacteria group bacterium]
MDIKNFTSAIAQIAEEKGISSEKVMESIEQALAAAYKKDYGQKGQVIRAELSPETGSVKFWQVKLVVNEKMIYSEKELEKLKEEKEEYEESSFSGVIEGKEKVRFNPEKHIMIDEAKKMKLKIKTGEELVVPLKAREDYGRIAAQTAKQVIMQRIREAEKESIFEEYKSKEEQIISGIVQRIEGKNVFMDIGKTLGVLTREEQVPGEFYRPGQRLKVYILKVEETPKGPMIFLSRAYPKLVSRLFELEVPEISAGSVAIKSIAREPGSRTKIAVSSSEEGIDPIGAAVGQRGTRVQVVINELGGEKIDIIEHSEDPKIYITNALSPAKVEEVKIMPKNKALAMVPEDQLSLAIGKNGQNVRLAAKLTGWKIDVRGSGPEEEMEEETKPEEKTKKEKVKKATKKVTKKKVKKGKAKTKKKETKK